MAVKAFCTRRPASSPRALSAVRKRITATATTVHGQVREEDPGELREGDGDGGDRAGLDDEHEGPAVEETGERAVELGQVRILAAGLGHGGGERAVAPRGRDREHAGQRPHEEQPPGGRQPARDVGGDDEDARPDHRARDERRGVE